MPFRQLSTVLVALIIIMGAALFVVTRNSDDSTETATTTTSVSTTTVVVTTTAAATSTTTTIPTECASLTGTTTTTASTSTSTTTAPDTTTTSDDTATTTTTIGPTLGPNSSVTTVGLDTVTFGLTVKQAEAVSGNAMTPCSPPDSCYRVTPADAPKGISFVVDSGTIERVDITEGPITTRSGLGVGTDEARVVEAFGDKLERQINDDGSIDLIFVPTDPGDADFRVIFTVRDGVVDNFRSGRVPLVLAADPCST